MKKEILKFEFTDSFKGVIKFDFTTCVSCYYSDTCMFDNRFMKIFKRNDYKPTYIELNENGTVRILNNVYLMKLLDGLQRIYVHSDILPKK